MALYKRIYEIWLSLSNLITCYKTKNGFSLEKPCKTKCGNKIENKESFDTCFQCKLLLDSYNIWGNCVNNLNVLTWFNNSIYLYFERLIGRRFI